MYRIHLFSHQMPFLNLFYFILENLLRAFIYSLDFKTCFKTMATTAYLAKMAFTVTEMYRKGMIFNSVRK